MPRTIRMCSLAVCAAVVPSTVFALNGGPLRVTPRNGWKAFEVITVGNDPSGDGVTYAMPGAFDGIGVLALDASNLRVWVNHENSNATVSEVNLNLASFRSAIASMQSTGTTGGANFVAGARKAWDQWSNDGGASFTTTGDNSTIGFANFCSSQFHPANTFGTNRGFVDNIYMTGAEITSGRMFALDVANRNLYRLGSTTVGLAPGGISPQPSGPWENAAQLDTGETNHVAILMSPDGDPATPAKSTLQLYIGIKGKGFNGTASSSFLARNGLAYGTYYYLKNTLPPSGTSLGGRFGTDTTGGLTALKLEDVDTNPNNPKQVALGVQESGLFTLDFNLKFEGAGGTFNVADSRFSVTKVLNHTNDTDGQFGDPDNVDWTAATTLNNVNYANGLIFVNEDSGTSNGETWMTTPAGAAPMLIADTVAFSTASETSGVLDISRQVGYRPGSVLLTSNQGGVSSMSVLINPFATLEPRHWDINGTTAGAGGTAPSGNWDGSTANFNTDAIGGNAGILVADVSAADTVVFSAGSDATGTYTVTLSGTRSAAQIIIEQGNINLTGGSLSCGTFDVAGGASAQISSTVTGGTSGSLSKTGAGTLTLTGTANYTGGTTVSGGILEVARLHENNAVTINAGATLKVLDSAPKFPNHPSGNDAFVSRPKQLTIAGTGTLDLGNNDMIIAYGVATPYAGVSPASALEDLIAQGFNGGDWLGTGITSSAAASDAAADSFVLAIADNASLSQPYGVSNGGDNFDGVDVPLQSVLVKFTHRVDLNLDGLITDTDAIIFSTNFENGAGAYWSIGDLNYDGTFSDDDAIMFSTFYEPGLQHLPEPGALMLLPLVSVLVRRKRLDA
jgi:autotransporter-associated beta strand protein